MKTKKRSNNTDYPYSVRRFCGILNSSKSSCENKLLALIGLAHIASMGTIKILEDYNHHPDPEMKLYAELALDEARYLAKA